MSSSTHQIEHITGRRVCIRFVGAPSRREINDLRAEVDQVVGDLPEDGEVLVDLTDVTQCDIDVCRALALMQRKIGSQRVRTAYLTKRARIHGAAWWVVHASRDPYAMPVVTMDFAERWFESDAERLDELQARSAQATERAQRFARETGKR